MSAMGIMRKIILSRKNVSSENASSQNKVKDTSSQNKAKGPHSRDSLILKDTQEYVVLEMDDVETT